MDINYGDTAAFSDVECPADCNLEIAVFGDGAEPFRTLRAGQAGVVDHGVFHPLTDPFIANRPVANFGHALLVAFVVHVAAIVGDQDNQRQLVMHRRPDRIRAHRKVTVTDHGNWQAATAGECQRHADRNART